MKSEFPYPQSFDDVIRIMGYLGYQTRDYKTGAITDQATAVAQKLVGCIPSPQLPPQIAALWAENAPVG